MALLLPALCRSLFVFWLSWDVDGVSLERWNTGSPLRLRSSFKTLQFEESTGSGMEKEF